MKNLIIIRHAKSSWDQPLSDINRPLTDRGISDAHLVSKSLIALNQKELLWWSSPARRAFETAKIFAQNLGFPSENIVIKSDLYTFDESQLETTIMTCSNDYDNVILFGHNEAITNFVNKFGDIYIGNVSTAGVVKLKFDSDSWRSLRNGKTVQVVFPRDLKT